MYDILILTHGPLAQAYKNTLQMFTSNMQGVYALGLDETGVENFREELKEVLKNISSDKELLVLCDLFGGSPFNIATQELDALSHKVEIVAGVNLPLLVEASIYRENCLQENIEQLKNSAKQSIMQISDVNISEEDE